MTENEAIRYSIEYADRLEHAIVCMAATDTYPTDLHWASVSALMQWLKDGIVDRIIIQMMSIDSSQLDLVGCMFGSVS